jgi:hypothetical protein
LLLVYLLAHHWKNASAKGIYPHDEMCSFEDCMNPSPGQNPGTTQESYLHDESKAVNTDYKISSC